MYNYYNDPIGEDLTPYELGYQHGINGEKNVNPYTAPSDDYYDYEDGYDDGQYDAENGVDDLFE